jgi:hypothetical protein
MNIQEYLVQQLYSIHKWLNNDFMQIIFNASIPALFFYSIGALFFDFLKRFCTNFGQSNDFLCGNDSNSETKLNLLLATITKASEFLKPSDQIMVHSGNYKIEQNIKINSIDTIEKNQL